ncbi:MAG: GNAT superfamily N-acetyltransferase [Cognaticolwellia sp.]|jgi:GNAT superfamily N-acetyltransferase
MDYSEIQICALAERPALEEHRALLRRAWVPWVLEAAPLRSQPGLMETSETEAAHTLLLWEGGVLVGSLISRSTDLLGFPDEGWDAVAASENGDRVCALAVSIDPTARGKGHAKHLLLAAKERFGCFVVPVRPTDKPLGQDMSAYLKERTADGWSVDPWLRTHERLGGQVMGISRRAMQMNAPWGQWEQWLGPSPATHASLVGVLTKRGRMGFYSEDNVWVQHGL